MNDLLVIPLLIGGCVMALVYALFTIGEEASFEGVMPPEEEFEKLPGTIRLLYPFTRPIGLWVRDKTADLEVRFKEEAADKILVAVQNRFLRLLISAGRPGGLEPPEFMGLMFVGGIAGTGVGGLMAGLTRFHPIAWVLLCGLLGVILPLIWLRDKVRGRQWAIRRMLPYALDLLTLSVEAGLDFTQALANIVRKIGPVPLAQEFSQMLREIQVGQTRAQALRDCSYRIDVIEFTSFASALIQADELGASLGPILRIQADQLRERRYQRGEEQAMKAPVKIIFPLVIFIFPVTLFVILFPFLLPFIARLILGPGPK